jgi:hypothetical protein
VRWKDPLDVGRRGPVADVYGIPDGRLSYASLYDRLKDEAGSTHGDSWVTTISLGSVRTIVKAIELFDELQDHVTDEIVMSQDGKLSEVSKVVVDCCEKCDRLVLRYPGDGEGKD